MIYPQPDRYLLSKHMEKVKRYVSGEVIDVGGGSDRYKKFFDFDIWTNANIYQDQNVNLFFDLNVQNHHGNKFDTVICNQVLGDVVNPQFSINELCTVAKDGGYIIITESLLNEEHDAPHDYYRFTEYAIKDLINRSTNNLEIVFFDKRGKYFSVYFQFINRILINRLKVDNSSSKVAKLLLYSVLKFNTYIALSFDKLIKHESYNSFYLGWIVVIRKI